MHRPTRRTGESDRTSRLTLPFGELSCWTSPPKGFSFAFSFEFRSKHFSFYLNQSFRWDFTIKTSWKHNIQLAIRQVGFTPSNSPHGELDQPPKHFSFRLNQSFHWDFTTKTSKTRLNSLACSYSLSWESYSPTWASYSPLPPSLRSPSNLDQNFFCFVSIGVTIGTLRQKLQRLVFRMNSNWSYKTTTVNLTP